MRIRCEFFFSSRRRHTRSKRDWSSDVCSSDLDPKSDIPRCVEITPATINDVEIGRRVAIEADTTYVFDKGYYHFGWWKKINDAKAFFVTRTKVNTRFRVIEHRYVRKVIGDGFTIIEDAEVTLVSKGDSRLPIPLRRIRA